MTLPGAATLEGTDRYRKRFAQKIRPGTFSPGPRDFGCLPSASAPIWAITTMLRISSITKRWSAPSSRAATLSILRSIIAVRSSERAIGTALKELAARGYDRNEIIIATKGGFLPFDGTPPKDSRSYFEQKFVGTGLATAAEIVGGYHCMTPRYLTNQLESSLRNLDVECIDIYYVHNPESQLGKVTREIFDKRLCQAFEAMEQAVASGKIRMYGTATWNGYRNPTDATDYLSLAQTVALAERAGGKDHHFKVIQLPLNLGMSEALSSVKSKSRRQRSHTARSRSVLQPRRHVQRLGAAGATHPQFTRYDS